MFLFDFSSFLSNFLLLFLYLVINLLQLIHACFWWIIFELF
ncbi:Uncharacterised protein [Klebsiella variicola]|nr:Uncharacterised protein [Klebsiella quasipneumoniae]SSL96742.1 Uncharacterised protein [Klebsiella variicola]SVN77013.1 Uncharacterised protein [Klebsiella pneumoniae]SWL32673.1 Uncharacterised protein [Klebsiella pneumoniae]SXE18731.1 Uncharacterised protein [Klebsiella variicola]